jgi:hypothetical protein
MGIDSDIVPARADFQFLLEPVDLGQEGAYAEDLDTDEAKEYVTAPPRPTRIEAKCLSTREAPYTGDPTLSLCDVLVCAQYAYKQDDFKPVQFGGGFYRAHRSVFSVLQQLKHTDNGRVEVHRGQLERVINDLKSYLIRPDEIRRTMTQTDIIELNDQIDKLTASFTSQAGTPRLWQAQHNGRVFYDYYPSGPLISQHVPCGDWKGEDHGFWTLCMLAGLIPRIETRTRLIHIGRKGYPYFGPDEPLQAHANSDGGNFQ